MPAPCSHVPMLVFANDNRPLLLLCALDTIPLPFVRCSGRCTLLLSISVGLLLFCVLQPHFSSLLRCAPYFPAISRLVASFALISSDLLGRLAFSRHTSLSHFPSIFYIHRFIWSLHLTFCGNEQISMIVLFFDSVYSSKESTAREVFHTFALPCPQMTNMK